MGDLVRTKANRPWLLKVMLVFIACLALGLWGLYDATTAYPNRGEADASYRLWVYLTKADEAGEIAFLDIEDPRAEYERLGARIEADQPVNDLSMAQYDYFRALDALGRLDGATVAAQITDNPRARLESLQATWEGPGSRAQPRPLSAYDLPVQWGMTIVGFAGALVVLFHMVRTIRVRYDWDEEEKRLRLPDGSVIEPRHLEDVDKRRWHKFIVFLKLNDTHDRHPGKAIRLDLYQHARLEGWILEMEKAAFPERADPHTEEAPTAADDGKPHDTDDSDEPHEPEKTDAAPPAS